MDIVRKRTVISRINGPKVAPDVPDQVFQLVWSPEVDRRSVMNMVKAAKGSGDVLVMIAEALRKGESRKSIQDRAYRFALVARHNNFPGVEAMAWCVAMDAGMDPVRCLRELNECCRTLKDAASEMECASLLMALNPHSVLFNEMMRESWERVVEDENCDNVIALLLYAGPSIKRLDAALLNENTVCQALSALKAERGMALRALINLLAMDLFPEAAVWQMARKAGIAQDVAGLMGRLRAVENDLDDVLHPSDADWLLDTSYTSALLGLLDSSNAEGQRSGDIYTFDLCHKMRNIAQCRGARLSQTMLERDTPSLLIEAVFASNHPQDADLVAATIQLINAAEGQSVLRRMQQFAQIVANQGLLPPATMFTLFDIDPAAPTSMSQAQIVSRIYAQFGQHDAAYEAALHGVDLFDGNASAMVFVIEAAFRAGQDAAGQAMIDRLMSTEMDGAVRLRLARIVAGRGDCPLAARLMEGLEDVPSSLTVSHAKLEVVANGAPDLLRRCLTSDAPAPVQKKRVRLAVFDPGFGTVAGHHMAQAEFLYDFYHKQFGFKPKDISFLIGLNPEDRSGDAAILQNLTPALAINPYRLNHYTQDAHAIEHMNLAMERDLEAADVARAVNGAQIFHWHTTHAGLISGFAKWAEKHTIGRRPIFVLGMIVMDFLATHAPDDRFRQACIGAYVDAIARLRAIPGATVIAYTETKVVRDALKAAVGPELDVHILPYLPAALAGNPADFPAALSKTPMRFGLVGGNRAERGLDLFAPLIERFEDRADLCWTLQMSRDFAERTVPDHIEVLERAERKGILRWLNQPRLEQETYFEALASMDCVVMPYRERYASSGSGVFFETLQLGKFLVIPHGTFMREALEEAGYPHHVAAGVDVDSFADAIEAVLDLRKTYQKALAEFQASDAQALPVGKFADLLQEALIERPPVPRSVLGRVLQGVGARVFNGSGE